MAEGIPAPRYPTGTGILVGFLLAVLLGVFAFVVSESVTMSLLAFVATGTALGVLIEQVIETRPLTPHERRLVTILLLTGVVIFVLLLGIYLFD